MSAWLPRRAGSGARVPSGALLRGLRPQQWIKNGVVFAALVFGHRLTDAEAVGRSLFAALLFSALSGAMYLLNDVRDAAADRYHPTKRRRPVAAGEILPATAMAAAIPLAIAALTFGLAVDPPLAGLGVAYVGVATAYTLALKRIVIVDVIAIAIGFVVRAVAGAVAIDVSISPWLLGCTFLLALLLGFGKRRHELATLGDAASHRRNLEYYTLPLLDQAIAVVAAATVMTYTVYTLEAPSAPNDHRLLLTVPFVVYAVLRYLFLIHVRGEGGSPEALLLRDRPLALAVLGWGLVCVAALYVPR